MTGLGYIIQVTGLQYTFIDNEYGNNNKTAWIGGVQVKKYQYYKTA